MATSSHYTTKSLRTLPLNYAVDILRLIRVLAVEFSLSNRGAAARVRTWYREWRDPPAYSILRAARELRRRLVLTPLRGASFAPHTLELAEHAEIAKWMHDQFRTLGGIEQAAERLPEIPADKLLPGTKPRWSSFCLTCMAVRGRLEWIEAEKPNTTTIPRKPKPELPMHRHMKRSKTWISTN